LPPRNTLTYQLHRVGGAAAAAIIAAAALATFAALIRIVPSTPVSSPPPAAVHTVKPSIQAVSSPAGVTGADAGNPLATAAKQTEQAIQSAQRQGLLNARQQAQAVSTALSHTPAGSPVPIPRAAHRPPARTGGRAPIPAATAPGSSPTSTQPKSSVGGSKPTKRHSSGTGPRPSRTHSSSSGGTSP
jgi:hypothetical protein